MGDNGHDPLTHEERDALEHLRRLSQLYVSGLVPLAAINGRRAELDSLVACKRVRRFRGTGPHSRACGRVHVYYTPCS